MIRDQKYISVFTKITRYSCPILMKPEFSRQVFWKIHKYQISWKTVQLKQICSMRTDGQTCRSYIVAFHNFLIVPKNINTQWAECTIFFSVKAVDSSISQQGLNV